MKKWNHLRMAVLLLGSFMAPKAAALPEEYQASVFLKQKEETSSAPFFFRIKSVRLTPGTSPS
jgi:hypothetical protein